MSDGLILGIDTSNYTTSAALISLDGLLVANVKRPLPVKSGERGLRQSDAVFAHVKNIPDVMRAIRDYADGREIVAIGVSERPRNVDGSYMPCFLSGVAVAEGIASTLDVPLYRFSHQCGHVMAALYSSGRIDLLDKEFCAFHVSGGTTEMLKVSPARVGFNADLVGGTADLNAGQVIDRIGVYMDLPFPCGPHIERLAMDNSKKIPKRSFKAKDMKVNLSGVENLAQKLYDETKDKNLVSAFLLDCVGRSILSLAECYEAENPGVEFVFAGGVMSNSIIKEMLAQRFKSKANFAIPELSSDNAVGVARLALGAYNTEK